MQLQLSKLVIHKDMLPETIRHVAGVDVGYTKGISIGAVAVLDFPSLSLIESQVAHIKTRFPYIPTLLSFREIPPAVSAIKKLQVHPDVFLADAHGIMHPYQLGFAAHLGLVIDRPTIGVAKSPLYGKVESAADQGWIPIMDKEKIIGAKLLTKAGKEPVYVSIGHKVSLQRAINIVIHCTRFHKIPEPTWKAHTIANEEKRKAGHFEPKRRS
ncbi:MAG: endonuclease V [Candidatus Bathyarchaeota archaeon]|nr:MAG: endonuclease V [Candidatus Bathyarchaeota archaeon]